MSVEVPTGGYTDVHRAFLQALLSRQTIDFESAKEPISNILSAANEERPTLPGDVTMEIFEDLINSISDAITPFDFEIRSSKNQRNGERIYALVNTTSDPMTQMATVHTADEIAFLKRVLDCMFETNNTLEAEVMAVPSMAAIQLRKAEGRRDSGQQTQATQNGAAGKAADITMQQAERVLESLVNEGWLDLSENDFYSLSQRGLMELRGWLEITYNEPEEEDEEDEEPVHRKIKTCSACREIITVGQRCPQLACHGRLHNYCTNTLWRAQRERQECPICKTPWQDAPPVGERAARHARRGRGSNGQSGRRSTNGRRSQPQATNGAGSEGDEDLYA